MTKTPCTLDTCRKHRGPGAVADKAALVRVGWYHENGEPHHVPGCRYYAGASHFGGIGFRTREDAATAGHPAATCCAEVPFGAR